MKKGQALLAKEIVPMLVTFIIVAIGIGIFAYLTLGNKPSTDNINTLSKEIHTYQLINSDQCFAEIDPRSGASTQAIDLRRFTNENLQKCYLFGRPLEQRPAQVTLHDTQREQTHVVHTLAWREGMQGYETVYPVLISNGTTSTQGFIEVILV